MDWKYVAAPAYVLFDAHDPQRWATTVQAHEAVGLKVGVADPTQGLYSPTYANKVSSLTQPVLDAVTDMIQGRRPLNDWDSVVQSWRSGGGDQARKEYQDLIAAKGK